MSNYSLMDNGTSLNFDGQDLQNQQEAEYRKEEEQQQHELRQLLTNAFDDLMDEDDILSVMSDDDENSHNGSLSKSQDNRVSASMGEGDGMGTGGDWGLHTYPGASITPSNNTDSGLVSPQFSSTNSLPQTWDFQQQNVTHQPTSHFTLQQDQTNQVWHGDQQRHMNTYQPDNQISESVGRHLIQRGETEGGNPPEQGYSVGDNHYWLHHGNKDYYGNDYLQDEQPRAVLFNPQQGAPTYPGFFANYESTVSTHDINPSVNVSYSMSEQEFDNQDGYQTSHQQENYLPVTPKKQEVERPPSPRKPEFMPNPSPRKLDYKQHAQEFKLTSPRKLDYNQDYKVQYSRSRSLEDQLEEKDSHEVVQENVPHAAEDPKEDKFMHLVGPMENREMAQLQILYKARGRKLEEMTAEFETVKDETAREIRILKHQLNLAKGEKDGNAGSLRECQALLSEEKTKVLELSGRLHAKESHADSLQKGKEDVVKKLQVAESAIETLNAQLAEMNAADIVSRARHEHEVVINSLQQRYEKEIHVLKVKIDDLNSTLGDKNDDISMLKKQLSESMKAYENEQISRADTINRLTKSLDESQKQCQALLDSTSSRELSQLKVSMQQAEAVKAITEDMCSSLQRENKDLKEQLTMLESASALSAINQRSGAIPEGHDDSIADLGIRKTLDFMTPETGRTLPALPADANVVSGLRAELERCLSSNRQKREELSKVQQELLTSKKEVVSLTDRCERVEITLKETQGKLNEYEELMKPGEKTNPIEARLRKELENLKTETRILDEDADDLKNRLEEVASSEERLLGINRQLNQQISTLIKEHDDDKRTSLERCKKTYQQLLEDAKEKLRLDLIGQYDEEKGTLNLKYEEDVRNLQAELKAALCKLDEVKELYVQVCEQKDKLQETMEKELDKELKQKVDKVKEELESEMKKERELEEKNEHATIVKVREQVKKEMEEDMRQNIETKVAMAKVEWFEEQRVAKTTAVENAVKLVEVDWRSKMEDMVQQELEQKVEQAKTEWLTEQKDHVSDSIQQRLQMEMEKFSAKTEAEFTSKLESERTLWEQNQEGKILEAVQKEKEVWQSKLDELSAKFKDDLVSETRKLESDFESRLKERLAEERDNWNREKTDAVQKLEELLQSEKQRFEEQMEDEVNKRLEARKDMFEQRLDTEIKRCLDGEKAKIAETVEFEVSIRLGLEKVKMEEKLKTEMKNNLENKKIEMMKQVEADMHERLSEEKLKMQQTFDRDLKECLVKEKEMLELAANSEKENYIEKVRNECLKSHEAEINRVEVKCQLETKKKIDEALVQAVMAAKMEWQQEHESSVSSAEMSQSVLKTEIEALKLEITGFQKELEKRETNWAKEKEEVVHQKDEDRKRAIAEVQDQCERDYKKFMEDHHDTLTQALKSARDQHTKEKAQLQERHDEEMLSLKRREERLIQQVQDTAMTAIDDDNLQQLESLKNENNDLLIAKEQLQNIISEKDAILEKEKQEWLSDRENIFSRMTERDEALQKMQSAIAAERDNWKHEKELLSSDISEKDELLEEAKIQFADEKETWNCEKEMLVNDISERDALLKKADEHIVQEVEKLRLELLSSYQSRLEAETTKIQQKAELDSLNTQTVDEKDRAETQFRLHEMEDELQKVKNQLFEESEKYVSEIHEQSEEIATKSQQIVELEQQVSSLGEKIKIYIDGAKDLETLKSEKSDLLSKLELMHRAIEKLKSEKSLLTGKIQKMESKYNHDISDMKQKQEDLNSRLQKTDKILRDSKQLYRMEIEKLRKSMEAENGVTIDKLKNKMIEMHKNHLSTVEALKRQQKSEKLEWHQKYQHQKHKNQDSKITQTASQEMDNSGMLDIRAEYLNTVGKIKDDVLRHVTETNLRAAETVKTEVLKERQITWLQLKNIKENVRRILQNEIIGANLETKLSEVERALDAISSCPNSRSATPRSELSSACQTPTRMLSTPSPTKMLLGQTNGEGSRSTTPTSQSSYKQRGRSTTPHAPLGHPPEPKLLENMLYALEKSLDNDHDNKSSDPFNNHNIFDKDPVWPEDDLKPTKDPVTEKREIYPHRRTVSEKPRTGNTSKYTTNNQATAKDLFEECLRFSDNSIDDYIRSSVHKTISEPDLSLEKTSYTRGKELKDDIGVGSYRYTSLRDTLKRPTSVSPSRLGRQNIDLSRVNSVSYRGARLHRTATTELSTATPTRIDNFENVENIPSSYKSDSKTVKGNGKDSQKVLRSVHKSEPFIRQTVLSQGKQPMKATGQIYEGMDVQEPPQEVRLIPPTINHTAKYSPPLIRFSKKKLSSLSGQ